MTIHQAFEHSYKTKTPILVDWAGDEMLLYAIDPVTAMLTELSGDIPTPVKYGFLDKILPIDWLSDSSSPFEKHKCYCDMVEILQRGCKCGGE